MRNVRRNLKQKTERNPKKCSRWELLQLSGCSVQHIQKNKIAIRGKKIYSGYFLLNVVNCKGKKCSEMKIVRRDDDVPDSI